MATRAETDAAILAALNSISTKLDQPRHDGPLRTAIQLATPFIVTVLGILWAFGVGQVENTVTDATTEAQILARLTSIETKLEDQSNAIKDRYTSRDAERDREDARDRRADIRKDIEDLAALVSKIAQEQARRGGLEARIAVLEGAMK